MGYFYLYLTPHQVKALQRMDILLIEVPDDKAIGHQQQYWWNKINRHHAQIHECKRKIDQLERKAQRQKGTK